MESAVTQKLLEYGVLGIVTLISWGAVFYLYKRLEALRDRIEEMLKEHTKEIKILQDEKLEMQAEHVRTLLGVKDEVTQVTRKVTSTLDAVINALTKGLGDERNQPRS